MAAMPVQYLHTKLRVHDLDAAIRFYETVFGYSVRARRPGPDESEIAFLVLPGEANELQLSLVPGGEAFVVPEKLMHLAFRVDDCARLRQAALDAGAAALKGPYALPSGSIVAFIRDLDGYDIELVQKPRQA